MQTIKLIALDLDGPLLVDTFSPLMRQICEKYDVEYSREIESNTFSRNRKDAQVYFREKFREKLSAEELNQSYEEMLAMYMELREEYLRNNPHGVRDGVPEFLRMLQGLDMKVVAYGGFPDEYMYKEMGDLSSLFERYICTNDFRPGVKEIVGEIYALDWNQALFVDDVNYVAEHAKALGVPFIGVPSTDPWSWQRLEMEETGVKYICDSVREIDVAMLEEIDRAATTGHVW